MPTPLSEHGFEKGADIRRPCMMKLAWDFLNAFIQPQLLPTQTP